MLYKEFEKKLAKISMMKKSIKLFYANVQNEDVILNGWFLKKYRKKNRGIYLVKYNIPKEKMFWKKSVNKRLNEFIKIEELINENK